MILRMIKTVSTRRTKTASAFAAACIVFVFTIWTSPASGQSKNGVVKAYPVASEQLNAVADALAKQFPPSTGARIAPDNRTSQLIVIAPQQVQDEIATYLTGSRTMNQIAAPAANLHRVPRVAQGPAGTGVYKLQNVTAEQFENSLRELWGPGLSFTKGATGTVVQVIGESRAAPVLRVDPESSTVHILVPGDRGSSWLKVVAALDRQAELASGTTELVPLQRADPAKVRKAVTMIRDAALRTQPGESMAAMPIANPSQRHGPAELVSMIFQDKGAGGGTPAAGNNAGAAPMPAAGEPEIAPGEPGEPGEDGEDGGILGDVQIEYIPELGVIVLRGSRRDVARVRKIIDEIEKQSIATQPEINVVSLSHTNSEALTDLIRQVYTEVYAPRLGTISMTALVKPNAILLVGRQESIDAVMKLVEKLDSPVTPDAEIKVFRLINMAAVNAEQYIQSFYGTMTPTAGGAAAAQQVGRGLATRVIAIADYRSNSLIVRASPRDMEEVAELIKQLDVEKTDASLQLKVFPLKNALATDLATVLQNALGLTNQPTATATQGGQFRPGGTTQNQNQASKSVEIIGIDQQGKKVVEAGLLSDVSIAADQNSNVLVVKAPGHSMGLIEVLVQQLDTMPAAESQLKVFQIQNGDATALTQMLQTLFGQQVTAGQIGAYNQTFGRTFGAAPQLQQSTAGESSLVPLSFATDARTNSIIASGSRDDLAVVEAILLRLDEGDLRQRKLIVYRLNNAPAQFVADALVNILNQQRQLYQQVSTSQQFSLISQFEYLDQQVFVVPEVISNTLVVSATPKYYDQVTEVIQDLDRRPPMIMIQVVVALVRLTDNQELGVELGIQDSLLFDRSTVTGGLLDPGFNFVNQALGNADTAASQATRNSLAGQAFSAFNVGRSSATEGYPGLVLSAGNESVNVLLRALAKKSRTQILSRPQIMTMNNVPASVLVGERVPQITDFQITNQGTVNSISLVETGISLGVIPRVTPDGLIIMDVEARDSKAGSVADGVPIGVQDGVAINSPRYDDITAITTIMARSGQTVVFGGLITSDREDTFRGVPYLSQIPVVGHLFRFDTHSNNRSELLFFMTPHIVMGDEDVERINQTEATRMSWCMADVIEVHGDPGFGAGGSTPWDEGTPVIFPDQDPTGSHATMLGEGEVVPTPRQMSPETPHAAPTDGKPFVLPPDQRTPGKPFLDAPGQVKPTKPFISPPGSNANPDPFGRRTPTSQSGIQQGQMYVLPPQNQAPPVGPGPYGVVNQPPPQGRPTQYGNVPVRVPTVPVDQQRYPLPPPSNVGHTATLPATQDQYQSPAIRR